MRNINYLVGVVKTTFCLSGGHIDVFDGLKQTVVLDTTPSIFVKIFVLIKDTKELETVNKSILIK